MLFHAPSARRAHPARALAIVAAVVLLVPWLAGCADGSPVGNANRGRVTLLLTDAPGDMEKAVVTIASIYLQGGADSGAARVVLRDTPITTDLLTLANTTAELVRDAELPAGTYAQLRFVITGGYVEVANANGSTSIYASSPTYEGLPAGAAVAGALQMPSFAQSGLKVQLPDGGLRVDGEAKIVLVDFDVARSFGRQAGNSGRWVMSPVLTATNVALTGGVAVSLARADSVTLPSVNGAPVTLAQFRAVLTTAAGSREVLPLTDENGDGVVEGRFRYVAPGDYAIDFLAPSDSVVFTTAPGRPIAVTVPASGTPSVAAVLTSARK